MAKSADAGDAPTTARSSRREKNASEPQPVTANSERHVEMCGFHKLKDKLESLDVDGWVTTEHFVGFGTYNADVAVIDPNAKPEPLFVIVAWRIKK